MEFGVIASTDSGNLSTRVALRTLPERFSKMNMPGAEEGIAIAWNFVQWVIGLIGAGLVAVIGWAVFIGRKIGGYENQFSVLRADLDAHRNDTRVREIQYDEQFEKLWVNDRNLEKLIAGLPDALMIRLEPRFSDVTRRIDEAIQRRRGD